MRPTTLFASLLFVSACSDALAVETGELRGELGAVRELELPTFVESVPHYAGGSLVSLDVEAPDGRQLMLLVTLPADFDQHQIGEEWGHGTHYVEGEVQPISGVWGCSRQEQGPWDIDTTADGGSIVIVPSDTPGLRRAVVVADFRLDEGDPGGVTGERHRLTAWFDFVPR